MVITQQTLFVLLKKHYTINPQLKAFEKNLKESKSSRMKSPGIPWPKDLLASDAGIVSSQEYESPALRALRPTSAMKMLKSSLGIRRIRIREGAPELSSDGKELQIGKEGFIGLSLLAAQFPESVQTMARGLLPLLTDPSALPGDWTAREWAQALLFLQMAHKGVEGALENLVLSPEGVRWLRQKNLPFSNNEIMGQLYEAQGEIYKKIYERAQDG